MRSGGNAEGDFQRGLNGRDSTSKQVDKEASVRVGGARSLAIDLAWHSLPVT